MKNGTQSNGAGACRRLGFYLLVGTAAGLCIAKLYILMFCVAIGAAMMCAGDDREGTP
jgi:hypothetical protein